MKKDFDPNCITFSQINMIYNARLSRRYQTVWIRAYIISRYEGIGTAEEAFGRLYLENSNFGDQLQIIFGRRAANTYSQLLNEFSVGIREMITAQMQGDTEAMQQAVDRLYRNVAERAAFLASINPYLNESQWKELLEGYLRLTIEEANSFASQNYVRDIAIYDELIAFSDLTGYVFAESLYNHITSGGQCKKDMMPEECITYEQMNAIFGISMLWFELITWIRSHMLSVVENLGNEEEIHTRLRLVADAFGNAMRIIFGEEAGDTTEQHINILIDLLDELIIAQMEGDIERVNEITGLLYQDAHDHAQHLASLNPAWEESAWEPLLFDMVKDLINMSTALLAGDYTQHMDIYSTSLARAETTSEYFAEGIYQYLHRDGQFGMI